MKKTVVLIIFVLAVVGIILVNQIQSRPIPDNEKYVVSKSIIGKYAIYNVQFSPNVLRVRLDYLAIVNGTQDVLVKVTLYTVDAKERSYFALVSVTGINKDYVLIYNNTILNPQTAINIPQENFYFMFPIISQNLQYYDFINLEQRSLLQYNALGTFIIRVGGGFDKYNFRTFVSTANNGMGITWDEASGIVVSYYSANTVPKIISLVETNIWDYPWNNLYRPTSLSILANDFLNIIIFIAGLYFMRWEVWALTFGIFGYYMLKQYIGSYLSDRKAMNKDPEAVKYLKKVEKQDEKVMWVV